MKTCLKCESETGDIVRADYVVTKNLWYRKISVKSYVCEKHLKELSIDEINSATKIRDDATNLNCIIRSKPKQGRLS